MSSSASLHRKQREFIPDAKKDINYWDRRRRNNEAAKRSREKRRINDIILEQRVLELTKENHILRAQLNAIRDKYQISAENIISMDQIVASMPTQEQIINFSRSRSRAYTPSVSVEPPVRQSVVVSRITPTSNFDHIYSRVHEEDQMSSMTCDTKREYCSSGDEAPPSPSIAQYESYSSSGLPFKLRHKTHLGEKEAANTLLSLTEVKEEAINLKLLPRDQNRESPLPSGSFSDSGVSSYDWSNEEGPEVKRPRRDDNGQNDDAIRDQLARLASEVESLKSMLNSKPVN
ncbi:hypothetical protein QYM36_001537 [Artemia franciscana]|uniref:BZIP domain-containing protein n=2 Tax=Artemia franciscana TaxID=6661 RepID=A0AA88LC95_ARTSF|nr:hypothetical protein QYM36_001537 [Artemia franciscana]